MGFTRRDPAMSEKAWEAVLKIGRYNCPCGKWIVLPRGFSSDNKLECSSCHRKHYWQNDKITVDEPPTP